jgi:hypothetical protein
MEKEKALLFRDKVHPDDWRVEWFDEDGGCEVAIFSGPNAEPRARAFVDSYYREFESR